MLEPSSKSWGWSSCPPISKGCEYSNTVFTRFDTNANITSLNVRIYIYTHAHTYTYIHTYVHIYIIICIYHIIDYSPHYGWFRQYSCYKTCWVFFFWQHRQAFACSWNASVCSFNTSSATWEDAGTYNSEDLSIMTIYILYILYM